MIRRLSAVLCGLVLTASAHAQTVDDIVAKHIEALGGAEAIAKVQTIRVTGSMSMGMGDAPVVVEFKRPDKQRTDFFVMGMSGTRAYDGAHGWQVMPFGGNTSAELMPDAEARSMASQLPFLDPLVGAKARGDSLVLLGKAKVDGTEMWRIKLLGPNKRTAVYYLDTETFLLMKEESKRVMRGQEVDAETVFGDYKEIQGLMVPFTRTSSMAGMDRRQVMSCDKVEVNIPIDDARFAVPAGAAPADSSRARRMRGSFVPKSDQKVDSMKVRRP